MLRYVSALAIVVCLSPASVFGQNAVFTVAVRSADVHKAPSTGSPVIGHAASGDALPVTRELGSWVKVSWPGAPDGVGYVHVSAGTIAHGASPEAIHKAAGAALQAGSPAPPAGTRTIPGGGNRPAASASSVYVARPSHVIGLGGDVVSGSPRGFGVSARGWSGRRFGVQLDVSRYATVDASTSARFSSMQLEPSAIYALSSRVSDSIWLRPYVGAGLNVRHYGFDADGPGANEPESSNALGLQAFGGTELTWAGLPQVAASATVGYRSKRSAFTGFDTGGFRLSVAAHWYIR